MAKEEVATAVERSKNMASRDHLMAVATEISNHMNAFRLAFKTYNTADFDKMINAVAGPGTKITGAQAAEDFEMILMQRGFVIFPHIGETVDGYVRVIRASSLTNNLLNAFLFPGPNGEAELARLLRKLKTPKPEPEDEEGPISA